MSLFLLIFFKASPCTDENYIHYKRKQYELIRKQNVVCFQTHFISLQEKKK